MFTPAFRQDLRQFFNRYPAAYAVFLFLLMFVWFTALDCVLANRQGWSFQAHVCELATRALLFALVFPPISRWWQRRFSQPATTKPGA